MLFTSRAYNAAIRCSAASGKRYEAQGDVRIAEPRVCVFAERQAYLCS